MSTIFAFDLCGPYTDGGTPRDILNCIGFHKGQNRKIIGIIYSCNFKGGSN
jgi:hypothetical protein